MVKREEEVMERARRSLSLSLSLCRRKKGCSSEIMRGKREKQTRHYQRRRERDRQSRPSLSSPVSRVQRQSPRIKFSRVSLSLFLCFSRSFLAMTPTRRLLSSFRLSFRCWRPMQRQQQQQWQSSTGGAAQCPGSVWPPLPSPTPATDTHTHAVSRPLAVAAA